MNLSTVGGERSGNLFVFAFVYLPMFLMNLKRSNMKKRMISTQIQNVNEYLLFLVTFD